MAKKAVATTTTPTAPVVDTKRLVSAYLKIRDAKNALVRAHEEEKAKLDSKLELVEQALLKFLNDHKMDSAKAGAATFYRQEEIIPAGSDWDRFYKWVVKHDAFEALERRIKKTFIKEYMEANDGAIPPGVTVHRSYAVRVRRGGNNQ